MESFQEYTFKPNPIRKSALYRIGQGRVERLDSGGRVQVTIDLSDVQSARWSVFSNNESVSRSLRLKTARRTFRIWQNVRRSDSGLADYLGAISATLSALAAAKPSLEVAVGSAAAVRWFFSVAYISFGPILALPIVLRLGAARSPDSFWGSTEPWWLVVLSWIAAASLLYAAVHLIRVGWGWAPWRPLPRTSARHLADSLEQELREAQREGALLS